VGRKATGGAAEALLLGAEAAREAPKDGSDYRALLKCSGRARQGLSLCFGPDLSLAATVVSLHDRGEVTLRFAIGADPYAHGEAPLPPYIRRGRGPSVEDDLNRYQTIYAREPGAIAAPTAGLHFTPELLSEIRHAFLTLHVGVGTFRPVSVEVVADHIMHSERYAVTEETARGVNTASRVVAVGTTVTRVLESLGGLEAGKRIEEKAHVGETDIFIHPPYNFRVVGGLLTNFHLPQSTLIMLVSAFAGKELVLEAYRKAVEERYRFYSYGDCMLLV